MTTFEQLRIETKKAFRVFMNDRTKDNLELYKAIKKTRDNFNK